MEIREETISPVNIAYAVQRSHGNDVWEFVSRTMHDSQTEIGLVHASRASELRLVALGTPNQIGHIERGILAIANIHGVDSPKTTVARDGLETSPESENALRCICQAYARHLEKEFARLFDGPLKSLTYAVRVLKHVAAQVIPEAYLWEDKGRQAIFDDVFDAIPSVIVEAHGSQMCFCILARQQRERLDDSVSFLPMERGSP